MNEMEIKNLSNGLLIKSLGSEFAFERKHSHIILLHLKEIQTRKLYADYGFPSLFTMLIQYFKQSETATNQRLNALKLMSDVPEVREKLISGEVNLSTLALAQRQIAREEKLTGEKVSAAKKEEIVERISSKTMRAAEKELMSLLPKSSKSLKTKERRISADESRLSISIPNRVKEKMERLKNHWAAINPRMEYLELIERSLDIALAKVDPIEKEKKRLEVKALKEAEKLKRKERKHVKKSTLKVAANQEKRESPSAGPTNQNHGSSAQPTSVMHSSNIDSSTNRKTYYKVEIDKILWTRANSQCEFTINGRRCPSKFGLQRDHIIPLALGGTNDIKNLRLLCHAHNQLMARKHFGAKKIQREIERQPRL